MFLMPTPYPMPRRTPSPRVVLPYPPGSPPASTADEGKGMAAAWRSIDASGAGESMTCPVGSTEPSDTALRARTSIGSSPSSAASASICDS
jgi:hypothetical protein